MKTLGSLILASCLLSGALSGHAKFIATDEQDMAQLTCKDFLADKEGIAAMLMWIDGYLSGKSDDTVISSQWIEKLGMHLGTFCGANPNKTLMQAIEAMPVE